MLRFMLLSLFIVYAPLLHSAGVYKCTDPQGNVTFQGTECGDDKREDVVVDNKIKVTQEPAKESTDSELVKVKIPISVSEDMQNECLKKYFDVLKDPRSAYVVSYETFRMFNKIKNKTWNIITLDARSKNGMGGYGILALTCGLDEQNNISDESTEIYKAMLRLGITP